MLDLILFMVSTMPLVQGGPDQVGSMLDALGLLNFQKGVHFAVRGFLGFHQQIVAKLDTVAGQDFVALERILGQR